MDAQTLVSMLYNRWMLLMTDTSLSHEEVLKRYDDFMDAMYNTTQWRKCGMCERPYPAKENV